MMMNLYMNKFAKIEPMFEGRIALQKIYNVVAVLSSIDEDEA